jgi:hypothetical protein
VWRLGASEVFFGAANYLVKDLRRVRLLVRVGFELANFGGTQAHIAKSLGLFGEPRVLQHLLQWESLGLVLHEEACGDEDDGYETRSR